MKDSKTQFSVRLIGYTHYRGLLLQARLCDEHGFVIGSLRGGRFLETPSWIEYGLRLQECDTRYPQQDSVTHSDDSRKFVSQVQWSTNRDVGNVQFVLTIASENDVYWERWRPRGGFLQPLKNKDQPSRILKQVFYNEKYALKFLAGKLTAQEGKVDSREALRGESTEKPTMNFEVKEALEKVEKPEFWANHDGEVKVSEKEERIDTVELKEKVEGEKTENSEKVNSGEAVLEKKSEEEKSETQSSKEETEQPTEETTTEAPVVEEVVEEVIERKLS